MTSENKLVNKTADPLISLKDVGVCYARKVGFLKHDYYWALKNVSLDLYPGETLGVVGRNGSGKSTLLKLLAGIIGPDKGTMLTMGATASLLSLRVGFNKHLTGRENAIMSGVLLGMTYKEVVSAMDEIADFADIGEFLDEPVLTYSSGMKARLGFSVAYKAEPEILLIDEALGVGDIEFKRKSSEAMKARIRSNKTVVFVSHSLKTINQLCNRAVLLEHGESIATGSSEEIVDLYIDKFGNKRGKKKHKKKQSNEGAFMVLAAKKRRNRKFIKEQRAKLDERNNNN